MNSLDLLVPGLCGPLPDTDLLEINPTMTSLAKLLAKADKYESEHKGFHSELSALFGFHDVTALPSAALCLLGENRELGGGHWFHADPVHLQADMDRAILRDSLSLELKSEESDALIEEVNNHFIDDGIRLLALDKDHWFLNIMDNAQIETTALHDVIGRNINFYLPKGKDEKFWKRFLNESQMLFHMSHVNQQRELSGELPVNSIWLWGGGNLPQVKSSFTSDVYADNSLVKGLANVHGIKHYPVGDIELLVERLEANESSLIVIDEVFVQACYGDISAWQDAMNVFYEQWMAPLIAFSMSRNIPVRLYPCNGTNYLLSPGNKYRIFRKANIRDHISVYE